MLLTCGTMRCDACLARCFHLCIYFIMLPEQGSSSFLACLCVLQSAQRTMPHVSCFWDFSETLQVVRLTNHGSCAHEPNSKPVPAVNLHLLHNLDHWQAIKLQSTAESCLPFPILLWALPSILNTSYHPCETLIPITQTSNVILLCCGLISTAHARSLSCCCLAQQRCCSGPRP